MKRSLLVLLCSFAALAAYAQPTGISVEYYEVHNGDVNGVDLEGYVTYHVYLDMTHNDDFLSAIYGLVLDDEGPDEQDVQIISDCDCYNDDVFGGFVVNTVSALVATFPQTDFDTFWTIGKQYEDDPGLLYINVANPADFAGDDPCTDVIDDGVIYTLNGEPNGLAGDNQRILIAQITSCSDSFSLDFCAQTFINSNPATQDFSCPEPFVIDNPCVANALPSDVNVVTPVLCAGDLATIEANGGGNGAVTYELYETLGDEANILTTQNDNPLFGDLNPGNYFIAMEDAIGCRDTIRDISIIEPLELVIDAELTYDGNGNADVCPLIEGGTSPFTIELQDPQGNVAQINEGECFTEVPGSGVDPYTLTITDGNNCVASLPVAIDVFGCTDETACNYDPAATSDDGSCLQLDACGNCGGTETAGCTDQGACNYDAQAGCDDGSCEYLTCAGCTDVLACNYDPEATIDDDSCLELDACGNCGGTDIAGCTDDGACNYDPLAACDDGSCEYLTCAGCTDEGACNYDPAATIDDGSCFFANVIFDCQGNCLEDTDGDGICDPLEDPDGSTFCGDDTVWDPELGQCVSIASCGPENCGTGTVWSEELGACVADNSCQQDLDNNGLVETNDLLLFLGAFGTPCP